MPKSLQLLLFTLARDKIICDKNVLELRPYPFLHKMNKQRKLKKTKPWGLKIWYIFNFSCNKRCIFCDRTVRIFKIKKYFRDSKVRIFWEGHKILRNLRLTFVPCSASQKKDGDFESLWPSQKIRTLQKSHK